MSDNREILMLAQAHDDEKGNTYAGWFVSEKLDGMRAFWDGGLKLPFYEGVSGPYTGLWSRYGKPIQAPEWWIEKLPRGVPLDGELYLGRGRFQEVISITRATVSERDWADIKYMVFDSPSLLDVYRGGRVHNNIVKNKTLIDYTRDDDPRLDGLLRGLWRWNIEQVYNYLKLTDLFNDTVILHEQKELPFNGPQALHDLEVMMAEIVSAGGEGLMLRPQHTIWEPKRVSWLIKMKPWRFGEGVVLGMIPGKGKLVGLFGSLTLLWNGWVINLSGFTDQERKLGPDGKALHFPMGSTVRFKYRELTDVGVPKEARYAR